MKNCLIMSSDSGVDLSGSRDTYVEYMFRQDALARMCYGHQ